MVRSLTRPILVSWLLFLCLGACKKPLENPELIDPIYNDLGQEYNAARAAAAAEEKSIKDLKEEIPTAPPRDPLTSQLKRELNRRERTLVDLKQRELYFQIRQQQRKEFARSAYRKAFDADLPWPDPKEVAEYKIAKKIKSAPRSWDARVPKTDRYNKKKPPEGAEKAEKSEKPKTPAASAH